MKISHKKKASQKQVIEAFFVCFPEQISMTHRFRSGFVISTNAPFNNNKLNMSICILLQVTNTLSSFLITYYFILSESSDVFIFSHEC